MQRLETCDPRLVKLIMAATEDAPFSFIVVCGHRGKEQQEAAVLAHTSKLHFPNSKHNVEPSLAVDLAPYIDQQIPWADIQKFHDLAAHIRAVATELNIGIQWGGDLWPGFRDLPHYQLPDQWPVKKEATV